MKCPLCKGKIESGKTNFPEEIKEGIVFICYYLYL